MKSVFQIIAAAACAIVLAACGGGSGGGATVVTPPTGVQPPTTLKIEDTTIGTGAEATTGKTAFVRYSGYLYDGTKSDLRGTKFDNNIAAANPYSFVVNANPLQVISGFNSGVLGMKVGGKRVVTIPPAQGYGASGQGPIPGNATLIFEIELISVN
jgi:FKBP-type peptidyl-prolyl cis-trans isomerase